MPEDDATANISDDEVARIEAERRDRLADENRPENAEVDNTGRDFDSEAGMFTDSPGYDPRHQPYDDDAGETGAARAAHGRAAEERPAPEPAGEDDDPGA